MVLFEFHGKIYEFNNFFVIPFIIILGIFLLILLFVIGKWAISTIHDDMFEKKLVVVPSKIQADSGGNVIDQDVSKEIQEIIAREQPITEEQIVEACYFKGRGRIADYRNEKYQCRKTEDLKIITFSNKQVYCCVVP